MLEAFLDRLTAARDLAAERRSPAPREAVDWPATIEIAGRPHKIEIGNISSGGLMARTDVPITAGTRLVLLLDGERLTGEVRWQRDSRFGMRFDSPLAIDAAVIDRYRAAGVEASRQMSQWMI